MKVLISDPLAPECAAILSDAGFEVIERPGLSPEALVEAIADCDALVIRSGTKVTADAIRAAGRLKAIGRAGAGVDNVDLEAATRRGIVVMNTPGGNSVSAAELAMAMMLALARRLPQATARVRAGEWPRKEFIGTELCGKRLGVVGLGRIGCEVARRALAFRMDVVAYDPFVTEERARALEVKLADFDTLVATADVITIHSPRNPDTLGLFNTAAFAAMKDGVLLVNCARGGIVDETALAAALESGKVAGCALDVFDQEPPPPDHPLLGFDQVIATPHVGATTREAQTNVAIQIAHQVVDVLRGRAARNAVNVSTVDPELLEILGPHIQLAEQLGRIVVQLADGTIDRLTLTYRGDMVDHDMAPLTTAALKGILSRAASVPINDVNAAVIAAERGLKIDTVKSRDLEDFANLITIEARAAGGATSVSGTLFGKNQPRIVRLNGFHVDVTPQGNLLVTLNHDRPGVIAHVSSVLASRAVNIADMSCGRDERGGSSLMVISIDGAVGPDLLRAVEDSPVIRRAQHVAL